MRSQSAVWTGSMSRSPAVKVRVAGSRKRRPAAVRSTPPWPRVNNWTPNPASRRATRLDSACCVRNSCSAARPKCNRSAAATTVAPNLPARFTVGGGHVANHRDRSRRRFHFKPDVMVFTARIAPVVSLPPWTYSAFGLPTIVSKIG